VGFGVGKGFAFPITAMTRDVGDSGDSRALRGHPSPPMHPTPSQFGVGLRDFIRFHPFWRAFQRSAFNWRRLQHCLAFVLFSQKLAARS
jgi:hypothetical protein